MKTEANVWEKNLTNLPIFSKSYESKETMFYFLYKIIIFLLIKEKYDIRSAYVNFNFLQANVNSHNLGIANDIAYVISAMKTHL